MSKELLGFSNGEYTFTETEVENQFLFYRNDEKILGDVGHIPMEFYQHYIMNKMFNGEITEMVANNIRFETSTDGKCIRLTVTDIGEASEKKKRRPNFLKRLFWKK